MNLIAVLCISTMKGDVTYTLKLLRGEPEETLSSMEEELFCPLWNCDE